MSDTALSWNPPPQELTLPEHEVHVWRANLDITANQLTHFHHILSAEESAKAQRFYFEKDRRQWAVARGTLRTLLGRYTQTDPRAIQFGLNQYGKPSLLFPQLTPSLQFNLSHSGTLALYAFTLKRELGVDVEYMRTNIEYDDIAKHSFSPTEQRVLLPLAPEQKHQAFYNCWTRKEAYIKARGMGLSLPLDIFDVSLLPGEPAALLGSRESPLEVQRWCMQELHPGPGYAGALAVEGSSWQLRCWQFPSPSSSLA